MNNSYTRCNLILTRAKLLFIIHFPLVSPCKLIYKGNSCARDNFFHNLIKCQIVIKATSFSDESTIIVIFLFTDYNMSRQ
jgi:hypothetical protein